MLHYGKSSAIISDNKLIHLSLCYKYYYTIQWRNERMQGGSDSPGTEMTMGAPNDCGGAENFQQCHKYLLQYSQFASIRPQIQIWRRQNWFLHRTPSNLDTALVSCRSTPESRTALQRRNERGKGVQFPGRRITAGGAENPNSITSVFFNVVHLLPKYLRFEHGGTKVASCPGRHLTSLRLCCTGSMPETRFWLCKLPESWVSYKFSIAFLFSLLFFLPKLPTSIINELVTKI